MFANLLVKVREVQNFRFFGLFQKKNEDFFDKKCDINCQTSFKNINKKIEPGAFSDKQFLKMHVFLTFLLYDLEFQSPFLNDMDIQLILEFRKSFGKYQPVFPKNPKKFFWTPCAKNYIRHLFPTGTTDSQNQGKEKIHNYVIPISKFN